MKIKTLKKRKDFVLSNKFGEKSFKKNFILQKFSPPDQTNFDLMLDLVFFTILFNHSKSILANEIIKIDKLLGNLILKLIM